MRRQSEVKVSMRGLSVVAYLFLLMIISLVACGGGGEIESSTRREASDVTPAPTTMSTLAPVPVEENSVFVRLLETIPDTPKTRGYVVVSDFALARELFDIPLPDARAETGDLEAYVNEVSLLPKNIRGPYGPFISGTGQSALALVDMAQYLAFDARNVDQSVEAGQPPGMLEVLRGRFDPDATDRALNDCSECPLPDMRSRAGISYYSWGEDLEAQPDKNLSPPAFDYLGRGGRIAVTEEIVFRTVETQGMEALLDTYKGERPSLADLEEFRLVAEGLSQLGVFAALISDDTQAWEVFKDDSDLSYFMSKVEYQLLLVELKGYGLLRPYQVFASGIGTDDTSNYMALVLVHRDSDDAEDNVELFRQRLLQGAPSVYFTERPWADIFDELEINAKGRVLLAKLRGHQIANMWFDWTTRRDLLIPHE